VKGNAPGLKSRDFFFGSRLGGARHFQNNLGKFLLLNPDFSFWRQRASIKGRARDFFWGDFYGLFPTFFLSPGDFIFYRFGGVFGIRNSKYQNPRAIS
jgi:hypothetical protein